MTSETKAAARAVQVRCSFCAKPGSEVAKVVAGPGVYICNECIGLCNDVLQAEQQRPSKPPEQRPAGPEQPPAGPEEPPAGPEQQVPAWEESMTDEQILDLLPRIAAVAAQTQASLQRLVTILRERRVTWARIGAALQITRQSAWERFSGEE
jgi:ATP-dependent Clp protease ATP-binding subunit ClpX